MIGRRKERKPGTAVDKPSFSPEVATQKGFLESVTKVVEQVIDSKLKENMTEKKIERRLKNERARNLIIHGLEQQPGTNDENLVKKIFNIVQVGYTARSISRLGKMKTWIKATTENCDE